MSWRARLLAILILAACYLMMLALAWASLYQ